MVTQRVGQFQVLEAAAPAAAHDGPPFPLMLDEKAGPYTVSVWADPDVGTGTFFIYVDAPGGSAKDVAVTVSVRPKSGRLPASSYPAEAVSRCS